ncbi:MAG: H4MPT-linked C1 transfer pathway protein [Candidatus Bathyarchaeota archaeon]|nr:H4MPT-linked C1 transfer pathway protein [Candidatus Bathyarchaeota archaeon]
MDIGGANTKAAYISIDNGFVIECKTVTEYFPVWKNPENLGTVLRRLTEKVSGATRLDCVGVTMTAELSDVYPTKREGVNHILTHVAAAFPAMPIMVLTVDATLKSLAKARAEPLEVAAANWTATGWLVAQLIPNCIVIDVGSTSTSIIPIVNGKLSASGKTDLEKLMNGELVYTGSLRTNIAAITNSIPLRNGTARVSSELFAQSGDAHLVLGNITKEEYAVETADGRGKTRAEALARLARVVCADTEMLTEQEIIQIATYIHNKQVETIAEGLRQVYSRIKPRAKTKVKAVVTGLGRDFLARKAAQLASITEIVALNELLKTDVATVSPAVGVALMAANTFEGRAIQWTR